MEHRDSKNVRLYTEIRMALQADYVVPGERIDPAVLAQTFGTSPTPVRCALYRLTGEGLVEDCAREGFHVPRLTEVALRDLYNWMEGLLIMACERTPTPGQESASLPDHHVSDQQELVARTANLFETIALSTRSACLHRAVRQTNDRLNPIRRAKARLIEHATDELTHMQTLWIRQDMARIKPAIADYHARRRRLVPRIIEAISQALPPAPQVPRNAARNPSPANNFYLINR